ncbi:INO80 complex subunit C-like isoform X2 [Crassostrea angulata]|uniref:INO80 complex subunit C isoform X2 n=1 Tax=Magallana gigas TaxID=29159 RepID=UPI0005C3D389|nr:INO80 complex subunit C-like isoform X2 [Crassostrea angulata]|eukprot:XP_011413075.1 PREDICTED: INO80 complex subunit C isoform X2 [Crassostrea gigas]
MSANRSKRIIKPPRTISPETTPTKRKRASVTSEPSPKKPPEAPIQVKTEVKVEPVIETEEVVVTTDSQDKLSTETQDKIPIFKNPTFVHSTKGNAGSKKTRVWKNLKQIVAAEKLLPWKPDDVTYGSIDAPPSFKPAKKYSDISGLPAYYTDPETKLRYATAEEFSRIRVMTSDVVSGCLALRRATTVVP